MKTIRVLAAVAAYLLATSAFAPNAFAQDFKGAIPVPIGKVTQDDLNQQIRIEFPATMRKDIQAFEVKCNPETSKGVEGWANNNTQWTFDFQSEYPGIPGGAVCSVTQVKDLASVDGKVWVKGTIKYSLEVEGPTVKYFRSVGDFNGRLRESQPVMLINFNGDVVAASVFEGGNSYLSYTRGNAPAEKYNLIPLPADKAAEVTQLLIDNGQVDKDRSDWVLATVGPNLIPGQPMKVTINKVTSKYTSKVSEVAYSEQLEVREDFKAKVDCATVREGSNVCLPLQDITVSLNAKTKWNDIKGAYIEYVRSGTGRNGPVVKTLAEMVNQDVSPWSSTIQQTIDAVPFLDKIIEWAGQNIPMLKFTDTYVDAVTFPVKIEAHTPVKIVLPQNLVDYDQRPLKSPAIAKLWVGSPKEALALPEQVSFFEKSLPNVGMPLAVVNLNQELEIRRTGTDAKNWQPVVDPAMIIKTLIAFSKLNESREGAQYTSPMDTLGLANNVQKHKLSKKDGPTNHANLLRLPFGNGVKPISGLYPIEVSSSTLKNPYLPDGEFLNPKYVLAQVTNLSIQMKRGVDKSLIWVTQLDNGTAVAGAEIELRNCNGEVVQTLKTDATGLVRFENRKTWANQCPRDEEDRYSTYANEQQYFVFAKTANDFTFLHSSQGARSSYALGAPGIEYYDTSVLAGQPFIHSIVGVNLVKPGQEVPVELIAKMPTENGYDEVPANKLPSKARVTFSYEPETYFDFPLTWKNGTAVFTWKVPSEGVKFGQYHVELLGQKDEWFRSANQSNIEVAEFRLPLMTGLLGLPAQPLIRPTAIDVNAAVRYSSNGVGAKNLKIDFSYFFMNSSLSFAAFPNYRFGSGKIEKLDRMPSEETGLPTEEHAARIEGLTTNADGSVKVDLGAQTLANGKTVAAVLKDVKRSQKLIVRATYLDQSFEYQTLSQSKDIYTSDKFVGTQLVAGSREDAKLQATVVGADGKPALANNALKVTVSKINVKVIGEELFGGLIRNTYEREIVRANWKANCATEKNALSCAVGTLKAGTYAFEASIKNQPDVAANFLFKVDAQGRVYSEDDYYDFGDDEYNRQMPLALNKDSYKAGDKAVVSFSAPFKDCSALVTLERENVVSSYVVANACQKGFIEVPVEATMAPNVFVSIYAVTGRAVDESLSFADLALGRPTYRIGYANLKVDIAAYKLNVAVKADKEVYKPREQVTLTATVSPEIGKLQNAKVTFVAIEEKILELKENLSYDVLQAFMQLRGHGVDTMTAMDLIASVSAKAEIGEEAALVSEAPRKDGEEGGDGGMSQGDFTRKLFDALVKFQVEVPVVNGVATLTFPHMNDSLTKFKVFAIVTDAGQKFGVASADYRTMKDTQATVNVANNATTGDQFPLRVQVQNNTANAQEYTVEAVIQFKDANGKVVKTQKLTKKQSVDKADAGTVSLGDMQINDSYVDENGNTVEVASIGYVVTIYDAQGNPVDKLAPDDQKIYPAIPLAIHDSYVMQVDGGKLNLPFQKERNALPGKGDITTIVSSSLVDGVKAQILGKLQTQAVESIFIESKMNIALLKGSATQSAELKKVLELMLNSTDSNGFVKYFPESFRGSPWLTVSIMQTLATESWAVDATPAALKAKFALAINSVLSGKVDPSDLGSSDKADLFMAQIMYASVASVYGSSESMELAQQTAAAVLAVPAAELKKWSTSALVQSLTTLAALKSESALESAVYKELTATTRIRSTGNQATLTGHPFFSLFGYDDEIIDTAQLLKAVSAVKGSIEKARPLAIGLINASRTNWYIPRTMVWVAAAAKSFAKGYESDPVAGTTRVQLINSKVDKTIDWTAQAKGLKVEAPWTTPTETLDITHVGQGKPWMSVNLRTAVPLTAPISQGVSIEKSIKNLTRDGSFQAGDLIEVKLTLSAAATTFHMTLRDPIPSGSNIVGEADGASYGEKSYRGYQFYFEALSGYPTVITYRYQLNNVGKFNMPPTRIEGVYLPSVFAEAPNATMTVK